MVPPVKSFQKIDLEVQSVGTLPYNSILEIHEYIDIFSLIHSGIQLV